MGVSADRYDWREEFGGALKGRVVLVTGATGFIGSSLCEALVALGAEPHGLSSGISAHRPSDSFRHWTVDIRDAESVHAAVAQIQPQIVYHAAGLTSAREERALVMPMLETHLCGTLHLLMALAEVGCDRVGLVASAEEARGRNAEDAVASPYGAAKTATSIYARMFHRLYGVPVVLVRPILAYGPRQHESKVIPYAITSLRRGEAPQLGRGERLCDFVYINDVIRGLLMAGIVPNIEGSSIDLGSGDAVRVRDVIDMLVRLTGASVTPAYGARPDRAEDPMGTADRAETRRLLGWDPLWSLEAGLTQTIDWYAKRVGVADAVRQT